MLKDKSGVFLYFTFLMKSCEMIKTHSGFILVISPVIKENRRDYADFGPVCSTDT